MVNHQTSEPKILSSNPTLVDLVSMFISYLSNVIIIGFTVCTVAVWLSSLVNQYHAGAYRVTATVTSTGVAGVLVLI